MLREDEETKEADPVSDSKEERPTNEDEEKEEKSFSSNARNFIITLTFTF